MRGSATSLDTSAALVAEMPKALRSAIMLAVDTV
jgi:hypothetical protein